MKIATTLFLTIISTLATSTVVAKKPPSAQSFGNDASSSETVINWPIEISGPRGTAVVYQPQPDSFKDDQITARAAVSIQSQNEKAPVFGAAWITARVSTDRDARTVTIIECPGSSSEIS
jgi:hypothetical protein